MSNVNKNDKKEEINISIDISFLNKLKNYFKKINLNNIKDNLNKDWIKNKSNKKYITYIVVLLLLVFVWNYSYNHYFYYKISKPYSDDIFVYDEYVDTIVYATEKWLNDDDIFKVFSYWDLNDKRDKNKTLSFYMIENDEAPSDESILEEQKSLEKKWYKMWVQKISEKMFSTYMWNYDWKISPYKTENFNKLDSNVSNKTVFALYSTKYDSFVNYLNELSILKWLFDISNDEQFEFKDVILTFNIDEKNDTGKVVAKFDLYNEFTSDRELSIFTKSIRSNSSWNENVRNFQIDYSFWWESAEVEISFSWLRNFINWAKDDREFFRNTDYYGY